MELRTIRVFVLVAKYLNFSKVADNMFLSQSSISKYISSLENELGHELFFRNTKSVSLTDFGKQFLPHAQALLDDEDRTKRFLNNYNTRQVDKYFTLGVAASLAYAPADRLLYQLVLAVEMLKKQHSNIALKLKYIEDNMLFPMLAEAKIDVALFSACKDAIPQMIPTDLTCISLCDQKNYLLYPADWGSFTSLEEITPYIHSLLFAPDPTPRALTSRLSAELQNNCPITLCAHWSEMFIEMLDRQGAGVMPDNLIPLAERCNLRYLELDERFISCLNLAWSQNNCDANLSHVVTLVQHILNEQKEL